MNLAEKLSKVDMTKDNRISETDRKYCETHQKAYLSALRDLKDLITYWEGITKEQDEILGDYDNHVLKYSNYIKIDDFSIRNIEKKIFEIHELFIRFIISYFNKTYNILLEANDIKNAIIPQKPEYDYIDRVNYEKRLEEWEEKMMVFSADYQDVIDRILIQLDGRTFLERAIEEIIESCHDGSWSGNNPAFEIKGDTIRFKDYFCDYTDWYSSNNWRMNGKMKCIIPGLYHFETGLIGDMPYSFNKMLSSFNYPELDMDSGGKLKHIKCFKNGRVDVKFSSKTAADEFADRYLGFVSGGGVAT